MAVRCSVCGKGFDVTLFEFGNTIQCVCGNTVTFLHEEATKGLLYARRSEDEKVQEIAGQADKIAFLIVSTDYHLIDIEIEKQKFRERIGELFPGKEYLYDLIYEPRFKRLVEQFRHD
jgi:hypothetical protein